jgi:ribosome-associated toxin RatA of RatAB toxin-antitoxin module
VSAALGDRLVRSSWICTVVLAVVIVPGLVDPDGAGGQITLAGSVALFALGLVASVAAFWVAVQRSRTEELAVASAFLLLGSAPTEVRRNFYAALTLQVVLAVGAAALRPFTAVAFAVLAPLAGLGLMALWGSRHGSFPPRAVPSRGAPPRSEPTEWNEPEMAESSTAHQLTDRATEEAMLEEATVTEVIDSSPQRCWELAADFGSYPTWAADIKEATVGRRDSQDRPVEVTFRAAAMGRSTTYTLSYDYSGSPQRLAWTLVHGDITRKLDGWYEFRAVDGNPDQTEVTYHLEVELIVPLPGFIKRRAEGRIMHTALAELKAHAEA